MRDGFFGCYFKCQDADKTVALIPALHVTKGQKTSSLQVVTNDRAWNVPLPGYAFAKKKDRLHIALGDNVFCARYIRLNLHEKDLDACGYLTFGPLTPLRYDIMGPFCLVPGMECRHSVYSMGHMVRGSLVINGERYQFDHGRGYMEGDKGRSFPKEYLWTQCNFGAHSLMLAVADIPLGPLRFTGIIGAVYWQGKEYRFATYLGAKVEQLGGGQVVVRQGDFTLRAQMAKLTSHPLYAPKSGAMARIIHESPSCRAQYSLKQGKRTLFSFESPCASFEYEYSV